MDLAVADEVRALRESVTKDLGSVDVLVSCCSPEYVKRLEDTAETTVKDILNINLLGPVWVRCFPQGLTRGLQTLDVRLLWIR